MTRGDQLIERAAQRLDELARRGASEGGFKGKLARPLAEDADLLRGMRPSLVLSRLRGEQTDEVASTAARTERLAAAPAQLRRVRSGGHGPRPIALVAGAFVLGLLLARVVDWRSHAHPRR